MINILQIFQISLSSTEQSQRKSTFEGNKVELPLPITLPMSFLALALLRQTTPLLLLHLGNTFQNRSVSSPAPVTIEAPSGLIAR